MYDLPNARPLGKVKGRMVSRFKVRAVFNNSYECRTVATLDYDVIAHTASDACNLIRDLWQHRPETEIITYGPQGGETRRYIGWESAIFNGIRSI